MASDALTKDWNAGPFLILIGEDGKVGDETGMVTLYRRVGPQFFANAKAKKLTVRTVTIQLVGPPVEG